MIKQAEIRVMRSNLDKLMSLMSALEAMLYVADGNAEFNEQNEDTIRIIQNQVSREAYTLSIELSK